MSLSPSALRFASSSLRSLSSLVSDQCSSFFHPSRRYHEQRGASKGRTPVSLPTAEAAIDRFVTSGDKLYVHMGAASPTRLLSALASCTSKLSLTTYQMSLEGPAPHASPQCADRIRPVCLFMGGNMRDAVASGRADSTPVFFSEIPLLFRTGALPLDVALIQISPPDRHGFCSLGVSVACCLAAVQTAKKVIALVNPNMPRTHGDGIIHVSAIDAMVDCKDPIHELHQPNTDEADERIASHVASLIPDGATLQLGIGAIANATLGKLGNHRNLGIHSELISDGVLPLLEQGVVNNAFKKIHPNKTVTTFLMGTSRLYSYIDDNPSLFVGDVEFVNFPIIIMRNPKVHAINSAIEVDLTGQVCADSIGTRMFSGVGGQMDFMRGAALSHGGKPIIALPSVTSKGESRIVAALKEGAGVVTTRAHVHYVVTEWGIAEMRAKSMRERAMAMCNISHPKHRTDIMEQIYKRFGKTPWTYFATNGSGSSAAAEETKKETK